MRAEEKKTFGIFSLSSVFFQQCEYKEPLNMSLKLLILINFVAFSASLECGKVKVGTSFVAGGAESGKGQWPWLAPLFNKNTSKFFCGSSIISKQHLLGGQRRVFSLLFIFYNFLLAQPLTASKINLYRRHPLQMFMR